MRELLLDDVPNLVHVGPQVYAADYAEALTSLLAPSRCAVLVQRR